MKNIEKIEFKEDINDKDKVKKEFSRVLKNIQINNIFFNKTKEQIVIFHDDDTTSTWLDEINVNVTIRVLKDQIKLLKEKMKPTIEEMQQILEGWID